MMAIYWEKCINNSAFDNIINGVKYKEKLNNPGKEITLVKIPGIGICQTEICRNYYTQPSNLRSCMQLLCSI